MKARELFPLPPEHPLAESLDPEAPLHAWLDQLGAALERLVPKFPEDPPPGLHMAGRVRIEDGVQLPPYGTILGPAWIFPGCELRPGVYLRGNVFAGPGCVLGNSCEYKNALLLGHVETPHYNYVGDSILGEGAHLGAGVILSNLRLDRGEVTLRLPAGRIPTGRRKVGAFLGAGAEVGCNAVLQPGTVLAAGAKVGPNLPFGGYLAPGATARWAPGSVEVREAPAD